MSYVYPEIFTRDNVAVFRRFYYCSLSLSLSPVCHTVEAQDRTPLMDRALFTGAVRCMCANRSLLRENCRQSEQRAPASLNLLPIHSSTKYTSSAAAAASSPG